MPKAIQAVLMYPGQIDQTLREANPAEYQRRFLAEGDSWFSFGSWKLHSVLTQIRFAKETAVVTLAQPGDTIRRMSSLTKKNHALKSMLSTTHGFQWDAVLISGGGNDVIDEAGKIIPPSSGNQPGDMSTDKYVDQSALEKILRNVRDGYAAIVDLRDGPKSPCRGVPLITHTYDLVTPRDSPSRFLLLQMGPWLQPALTAARIPPSRWNDVADYILSALARALQELETTLPNFHVAPTQGTLTRANPGSKGISNDWDNEIHPHGKGFKKIADLISARVDTVLAQS